MATMANWNGHTFEIGSRLIRAFDELKIKGACETTDKNSDKQKYVERKYGEIPEVSLTVHLNALTGVSNVYGEAMQYVQEATDGATAYFYLGGSKVIPAEMMLVEAQITEVVHAPARGDTWISCDVALKFKQGTKGDGSSGGGGGGGKISAQTWMTKARDKAEEKGTFEKATQRVKSYVAKAKADSKSGTETKVTVKDKDNIWAGLNEQSSGSAESSGSSGGLQSWTDRIRETKTEKDTGVKTSATTGKASVSLSGTITKTSVKNIAKKAINRNE